MILVYCAFVWRVRDHSEALCCLFLINYLLLIIRLGRISDSLARSIKDDIRSEIGAVKAAADRDRESQTLSLARRLNDDKKQRIVNLVNIVT